MAARKRSGGRKKSSGRRKSGGRKYGKAASKRVESAMRRRKRGTLKSGRGGKGRQGEEPQAGNRDRTVRSAQERREGPAKEGWTEEESSMILA